MLKSKKKDLLSEKAALNKAAKEAVAAAEKKKKRMKLPKKKDDARLDAILSKAETGAKNSHKQLLKEFLKTCSWGRAADQRKWNMVHMLVSANILLQKN